MADFALDLLDVDKYGLDHVRQGSSAHDYRQDLPGGPVGLDTLAASIGEDAGTIEDVYEPYLLKNGFLLSNTEREGLQQSWHMDILGIIPLRRNR